MSRSIHHRGISKQTFLFTFFALTPHMVCGPSSSCCIDRVVTLRSQQSLWNSFACHGISLSSRLFPTVAPSLGFFLVPSRPNHTGGLTDGLVNRQTPFRVRQSESTAATCRQHWLTGHVSKLAPFPRTGSLRYDRILTCLMFAFRVNAHLIQMQCPRPSRDCSSPSASYIYRLCFKQILHKRLLKRRGDICAPSTRIPHAELPIRAKICGDHTRGISVFRPYNSWRSTYVVFDGSRVRSWVHVEQLARRYYVDKQLPFLWRN